MKGGILILFLFVSTLCFAYKIVEYRVEGSLVGQTNGKYAYLQLFSNQFQKSQLVHTSIINKTFVFTGKIKCNEVEICMARLFISDKGDFTFKDIMILIKSVNYDMRNLVLEKNVIIEIDNSVKEAQVKGGELNDINNLFYAVDLKYQKKQETLDRWYNGQKNKYDDNFSELQKVRAEYFELNRKQQEDKVRELLDFVKKFPFSKQAMERFTMIAVVNENSSAKYQQVLEETWNGFPDEVKTTKEAKYILSKLSKTWNEITLKEGTIIPDFTFRDDNHESFRIKDYRGKYLLIDFWTTWCVPCRAEHYNMKKAFEKFKVYNFSILQVSLDEKKELWLKAVKEDQLPWTNVRNVNGWDKEIEKLFNIQGVPTNYLVDPDGKIVARNLLGEELDKILSKLLASEKGL